MVMTRGTLGAKLANNNPNERKNRLDKDVAMLYNIIMEKFKIERTNFMGDHLLNIRFGQYHLQGTGYRIWITQNEYHYGKPWYDIEVYTFPWLYG